MDYYYYQGRSRSDTLDIRTSLAPLAVQSGPGFREGTFAELLPVESNMNSAVQKLKTAAVNQQAIVLAYRHLYRQGLKAVNYSTPARHVLRRILRSSFRSASRDEFDPNRVVNTLQFLERAADSRGLEHKIVKNLIMVRYWEQPQVKKDARV